MTAGMGQGGVGARFLLWENQQVKASGVFGFIPLHPAPPPPRVPMFIWAVTARSCHPTTTVEGTRRSMVKFRTGTLPRPQDRMRATMICEAIPTQMTLFLQETGSIKILHSQGPGRRAQPGRHAQRPAGPLLGRRSCQWTVDRRGGPRALPEQTLLEDGIPAGFPDDQVRYLLDHDADKESRVARPF